MTPEQKQRIERIRRAVLSLNSPLTQPVRKDVDFLLSLVKSQEADEGATRIERLEAQLQGVLNSLATSQREVERLRDGKFTAEEFQNLCHNLNGDDKTAFLDGCAKYQEQLFGVSAATSTRSACVEKVKSLPDHSVDCNTHLSRVHGCSCSFRSEAIKALESLSIEQPKERE